MKMMKQTIILLIFTAVCSLPGNLAAETGVERWASGPWQSEDMLAWGNDALIVDFGSNGLWKYTHSWIRLSLWDPEAMLVWGDSKLVVDFGFRGLWRYDGSSWEKIALGSR